MATQLSLIVLNVFLWWDCTAGIGRPGHLLRHFDSLPTGCLHRGILST
jgi:hypothetical protein